MKTHLINRFDALYPSLLKEIYSPPDRIYIRGDPTILNKTCISIVGTRNISEYGEFITKKIIDELSLAGVVIVSGVAKGVDSVAHSQAIKNGLKTIAVLGHGLDFIYPRENSNLYSDIERNGVLMTEYLEGTRPTKFTFPARNQIISGISIATIVIEAPIKSGALITARAALDQGRDVFVIPGDIDRENSLGCLSLLQKGSAYPISSGREVLDILNLQPSLFKNNITKKEEKTERGPIVTGIQKEIIMVFKMRRLYSFDEIINGTNSLSVKDVLVALSELELKKIIMQKKGKYKLLI